MFQPAFRSKAIRTLSCTALFLPGLALPGWAWAQQTQPAPVQSVSRPIVQPIPQKSAGMRLDDALGKLARNPQDVAALIEAGKASLELGDAQASIGFYQRALQLQPGNAVTKAALAGAHVMAEDPFTAIELFDEAEKAGPIAPEQLANRGLAFDLVGDFQTAQFYYRQSLAGAPSDETLRRLALSQAIARDRKGMDQTLNPLLQKQDKAAWRTRALGLAIMGQTDEAEEIARQTMPPEMATAITAYLRYMPRLTAAQQAAAGNTGRFPRAAEIGNDDPRLAFYSRSRVQVAAAPAKPAATAAAPDKGKGRGAKGRDNSGGKVAAAAPKPAPVPPPEPLVSREVTESPTKLAVVTAPPKPAPTPAPAPPPPPPPPSPAAVVAAKPASVGPGFSAAAGPAGQDVSGFNLGKAPSAQPPAPTLAPVLAPTLAPAPAQVQAAAPQKPRKAASIDDAFADFEPPSREVEVQAGAVDVRRIKPVAVPAKMQAGKPKEPVKETKPAAPSHPSRIWVQIATGRDKSALGFDWRKLARENPAVFKGQKANVTAWGQSKRLLAGPFATTKEANAFLAALKKAGVNGAFVWTSPAGQLIDLLGGGK